MLARCTNQHTWGPSDPYMCQWAGFFGNCNGLSPVWSKGRQAILATVSLTKKWFWWKLQKCKSFLEKNSCILEFVYTMSSILFGPQNISVHRWSPANTKWLQEKHITISWKLWGWIFSASLISIPGIPRNWLIMKKYYMKAIISKGIRRTMSLIL